MGSTRTTFSLDEDLADQARKLGVNVSAAARNGVAEAVRSALAEADRLAYTKTPETVEESWSEAEVWGAE